MGSLPHLHDDLCETGLVVALLPGDSLLFVIGALGASGDINLLLFAVVIATRL